MIVQEHENNVFDQHLLELALQRKGIETQRRTFRELHAISWARALTTDCSSMVSAPSIPSTCWADTNIQIMGDRPQRAEMLPGADGDPCGD